MSCNAPVVVLRVDTADQKKALSVFQKDETLLCIMHVYVSEVGLSFYCVERQSNVLPWQHVAVGKYVSSRVQIAA
jgi:hypothetical protein